MARTIAIVSSIAVVIGFCYGKSLSYDELRVGSPRLFITNDIQTGLGDRGRKRSFRNEFDGSSNEIDYLPSPTSSNVFYDNTPEVDVIELNFEIDDTVFASSGDVGEALRQVWESFSGKMKVIEGRVTQIEQQTLEILNRLSVVDCSMLPAGSPSGIYTLYLDHGRSHPVRALCEQEAEGGGWTVILNRIHHEIVERAMNFSRDMRDYKVGFGSPEGDFWVGLENIYQWTRSRDYQLRIELEDFNGDTSFAHYEQFYLENEKNGYRLQVSGYRGNAGDSLTNLNNPDNFTSVGMMFSSQDEDHDTSHEINCAAYWDIGGWWYNRCSWANLMGPYMLPGSGEGIGINWHKWRNKEYIKAASMMIRPGRP